MFTRFRQEVIKIDNFYYEQIELLNCLIINFSTLFNASISSLSKWTGSLNRIIFGNMQTNNKLILSQNINQIKQNWGKLAPLLVMLIVMVFMEVEVVEDGEDLESELVVVTIVL